MPQSAVVFDTGPMIGESHGLRYPLTQCIFSHLYNTSLTLYLLCINYAQLFYIDLQIITDYLFCLRVVNIINKEKKWLPCDFGSQAPFAYLVCNLPKETRK